MTERNILLLKSAISAAKSMSPLRDTSVKSAFEETNKLLLLYLIYLFYLANPIRGSGGEVDLPARFLNASAEKNYYKNVLKLLDFS